MDFETRSEVDIWKVGAWQYSVHPSTEILCMAVCVNDKPIILLKNFKNKLVVTPDYLFAAHYSMFENYIWHNILVKKFGWPRIPLRQWRCTAALAAAHALPRRLKNAALVLNLKHQKDEEGRLVMLKLSRPSTKKGVKWNEDPEDFKKLYDYCINDVEVERDIHNVLPELSEREQEVWFLDQVINTRGIRVDREAVKSALYLIDKFTTECNEEVSQLTNGYLDRVSQRARVLTWIKKQGVHLEGYTKDDVISALKNNMPEKVKRVLEIRQQTGKTSVKKYEAFDNATCEDDRVRDMFVYHGASTGRWAGKIVQLHNLPRGILDNTEICIETMKMRDLETFKFLYPDVMGAFSSCIRGMLIAASGKELMVADFSAIEAVVLAWVAKEEKTLNCIRTEGTSSLYIKMAEFIFETKEIDAVKKFVGKQAVLGCGYGMWVERFQATCESYGQKISKELAKKATSTFRKQKQSIVDLWYIVEKAAIEAVKTGKTISINGLKFFVLGEFLYIQLPSGRKLAYHHPEIKRVERYGKTQDQLTFMAVGENTTYVKQHTWGGTLVENIIQAISRDILVEAMLRLEKKDYSVVLHVHDEVVCEVPEGFGSLEEFLSIITLLPKWAKGCPVEAKGWKGKRYKK